MGLVTTEAGRAAAEACAATYTGLGARVFRPSRPRWDEALAATRKARTAQEAWETLAARALLPMAMVDDPARRFGKMVRCRHCTAWRWLGRPVHASRWPWCKRCFGWAEAVEPASLRAHPPNVLACAAFAADPEGVAKAEALAREMVARRVPWGAPPTDVVVWHAIAPERYRGSTVQPDALRKVLSRGGVAHDEYRALGGRVGEVLGGGNVQIYVSACGVDHTRWCAAVAEERPEVAARLDPFEPERALWATGYGLVGARAEGVVLALPVA